MPSQNLLRSSWAGGELSRQMEGRADLAVYAVGSRALSNFLLTKTAGIKSRPGWEVVLQDLGSDALNVEEARLVPMIRTRGQFSLLAFGWQEVGRDSRQVALMKELPVSDGAVDASNPVLHLTTGSPDVGAGVALEATPATPTDLRATPSNRQITWRWNASARANSYDYEWRPVGSDWTVGSTAGTSFTAMRLQNDRAYELRVRAKNEGGFSAYSESVAATPQRMADVPTDLEIVFESGGDLALQWRAARAADYYTFSSREAGTTVWDEDDNRIRATYWRLDGFEGRSYDFRVRAHNSTGASDWSATVRNELAPTGWRITGRFLFRYAFFLAPYAFEIRFTHDFQSGLDYDYEARKGTSGPWRDDLVTPQFDDRTKILQYEEANWPDNQDWQIRARVNGPRDNISDWSVYTYSTLTDYDYSG